jgi:MFS transporter, DHA1 family, multidrug resistance protein
MMNRYDKKIFATLFLSTFAVITGVGIVVPLLPVYAHDLGASGLYIGLIFGAFSLSRTFFLPYFGRLSDRKGRKPFIVTGLFAYAMISVAFVYSSSVESLIALRFIQGIVSAMIMPVTQAYVGDITPEGREGFAMGLFNMSVFCGLSLGPLIGGGINDFVSLDVAFLSMGGLAMVGFALSLWLLPPRASERVVARGKAPVAWRWLIKDREVAGIFAFRFAYTAAIGMIWAFLPVFADAEFSLNSSSIGVLVMLGVFVSGLIHTPMGLAADRFNRHGMVIGGGVIAAGGVFYFKVAQGFGDMFIANLIFGLGGGISMPALMALAVLKGHKTESMGSVMALLTMAHSLGMLFGSIVAGLTMDALQLRQAFFFGGLIMGLGVITFVGCTFRRPYRAPSQKTGRHLPTLWE